MAYGRLAIASFGQRAPERRIKEDRIVAESSLAFRLRCDASFDSALRLEQNGVALGERERADEPRAGGGRGTRAQTFVDQREFLRVRRVRPSEPGRFDARCASERVDSRGPSPPPQSASRSPPRSTGLSAARSRQRCGRFPPAARDRASAASVTSSIGRSDRSGRISRSLASLVVATRSVEDAAGFGSTRRSGSGHTPGSVYRTGLTATWEVGRGRRPEGRPPG